MGCIKLQWALSFLFLFLSDKKNIYIKQGIRYPQENLHQRKIKNSHERPGVVPKQPPTPQRILDPLNRSPIPYQYSPSYIFTFLQCKTPKRPLLCSHIHPIRRLFIIVENTVASLQPQKPTYRNTTQFHYELPNSRHYQGLLPHLQKWYLCLSHMWYIHTKLFPCHRKHPWIFLNSFGIFFINKY